MSQAQIEEQLRHTREEITDTLNQLVDQVDPRRAVKRSKQQAQAGARELGDQAKVKARDLQVQAQRTLEDAKHGDNRARAILAGAAAGAGLVGFALVRRLIK
nr:DUF3618 domain-containing protein [Nanchangia anserum]